MKSIKRFKVIIFISFITLNISAQVIHLYSGEKKGNKELSTIKINNKKSAESAVYLFSINDSTGINFKLGKYFFNSLSDLSCEIKILPGKLKLELGSKNIIRRYLIIETMPNMTYLIKEENNEFVVYCDNKIVKADIVVLGRYDVNEIKTKYPKPSIFDNEHKVLVYDSKQRLLYQNVDVTFSILITKVDGLTGFLAKEDQIIYACTKNGLIDVEKQLVLSPGIHTLEYIAYAYSSNDKKSRFIVEGSPKKITYNFEENIKYHFMGIATLTDSLKCFLNIKSENKK